MAPAVSTADHCQIGPLGKCTVAEVRNTAFLTAFVTVLLAADFTPREEEAFFFATFFCKAFSLAVPVCLATFASATVSKEG